MCAVLAAGNYSRDSEFRAHLAHFHSDDGGSTNDVDNPLTLCYLLYHPCTCVTLNINEVDQVCPFVPRCVCALIRPCMCVFVSFAV